MRLFVGIKRGQQAPTGWPAVLETIAGVRVLGADLPRLVRVEADEAGLAALRERFGAVCRIEPPIEHRRQQATDDAADERSPGDLS